MKVLSLCLILLCFSIGVAHASTLKIGILSFQSKEDTAKQWTDLESYLNNNTHTSDSFQIIPMYYDELDAAVDQGSIDFILTNTGHYVKLEREHGISAIASLEKRYQTTLLDKFGGVIFTRSDRADINALNDLRDASFMAVNPLSLGGFLAAAGEFQNNGIDPNRDFRQLLFTGMPHNKVVENVLHGKADAGTVRTGVLESLVAKGIIQTSDFKVLNKKSNVNFPLVYSTALYPEWPFAVMPLTNSSVANSVALALISAPTDQNSAYSWKISKNYKPVHQLMQQLGVPPYNLKNGILIELKKYKTVASALLIAIILMILISVRLHYTNKKLLSSQQRAKHTATALEHIATNAPLTITLKGILAMIEDSHPSIYASISLLENDTLIVSSPGRLPEEFINAVSGIKIGPEAVSFAASAFSGERIVVEDISADPHWALFKQLALQHGLRSCWSEPIINSGGIVLGVLSIYCDHPSSPGKEQMEEMSSAAYLARIGIEREQSETMLRKLAQAVEQTGDGIMITNHHGDIEFVNHAFTQTTGYSLEDIRGKNPRVLNSGQQGEDFYNDMWQEINDTGDWIGRVWNQRKNGETYPERLHITAVKSDSTTTHYVGVFSDVTEQLSVELQLNQAQKMEAIGTLVGGIAHDFNNILAGILGNTFLLKEEIHGPGEMLNEVTQIEELGFRAKALISQMLAFARKGIVKKASFNLTDCAEKAIYLVKVALPKEISFKENISEKALPIYGDDALIQQVIVNLLNNARDAVEEVCNPIIKVTLQLQNSDPIFKAHHNKATADQYAYLTISDNGTGMSKKLLEHIFEPFFTSKEVNKGTGLGLSMALGTIQSHHGFIDVDSQIGKGSVFHIYLPLSKVVNSTTLQATVPEPAEHTNAHILIADDEPQIIKTMAAILESDGYIVHSAADGKEALAMFSKHQNTIRLAILDISMPQLTGIQVAKKIRKSKPFLPIIFYSGYDNTEMPSEFSDCQFCRELQKPVPANLLKQSILELLTIASEK